MKQILKWTGAALLLASLPIAAEGPAPAATPQLPNANIDVSLQFASNYVFRGTDMHQNMFNQKRQSIDGKNEAWAFQPTITMKTPVDGLYVSIFGNFALEGREDKDVDQRFQTAPGAGDASNTGCGGATYTQTISNVLIDSVDGHCNGGVAASSYIRSTLTTSSNYFPGGTYAGVGSATAASAKKEANGLKRADEIDITIGYTASTKVGVIGFGAVTYNYVNGRAKANPFGNLGSTYFGTEMFATYALPFFPDLTAKIYGDVVNSNQYYQLVYAKTININDSVAVSVSTGPGYSIEKNLYSTTTAAASFPAAANAAQVVSGWRDWTSSVGVTVKGFNVNFNAAYRPDLRFFDGDYATSRLVEADGGSTNADGLVADPKWVGAGPVGDILQRGGTRNGQRINSNYAYTPRQKLPKWLYWVNLGYTVSL